MSIPSDEAAEALQVEFLKALVRVPSDNPPGDCGHHAEVAGKLLEELGFIVERHPVPEPFVKTYGMKSVVNLVVRERFGTGKGPVIALNAHGDVVPPGEGWTFDPYGAEEKGGAIYGRGAAVSKSDFATYAFALLGLKQRPEGLDGTVELHFTYDEEAGGFVGPKWLIEHDLTKPDYAISAGFSYAVVVAHNGALHLEIVVRGKQAHAAMPETGADALEAATAILSAIYGERRRLSGIVSATPGIGSPKITVGLISGGINTNVVPDRIVMRVDRRLTPEEDGTSVEAGLNALVEAAVAGMAGHRYRVPPHHPRRAAAHAAGHGKAGRDHPEARDRGAGRDAAGDRRAALHRCPPLHGGRRAHRALRRRPALDPRSQCPCRRRACADP